jgi:sugar/nucleoside kinase (ribokinase family)
MNFLIVGHSVVDKIYKNDDLLIKPGGIFYTTASLLSFCRQKDKLFLCTTVDRESHKLFSFVYNKVEQNYIQLSNKIPTVQLKLKDSAEREEKYEHITEKLNVDFTRLINFDGILINMITGFDVSIEQLEHLSKIYSGIKYFDVHTLSRGVDNNLNRKIRPIPGFGRWARCIDILQANEAELRTLSTEQDEASLVEELFNFGIRQIIITMAERGAKVYYKEKEKIESVYQSALQTKSINQVGCGDVFGAVYFYNYILNKNVHEALLLANIAAGVSTEYTNPEDFLNLKEDVRRKLDKK